MPRKPININGALDPLNRAKVRSTTILCVRRGEQVAIASDGQVTVGNTIMKSNARKLRRIYHDRILAGFAGATADALTLFEKFEQRVEEYRGELGSGCGRDGQRLANRSGVASTGGIDGRG